MRRQTFLCLPTGEHDSSACIRSDDHGLHWQRAGAAEFDFATSKILPSESSIAELPDGRVLLNTRNSCHRLPAPNNCCWGCGCCKTPRCTNAPMPAALTAESVRRLPRLHSRNCSACFSDDSKGKAHCCSPTPCDNSTQGKHSRILMISTDQGMSFSPPERCHAMPDPDKEGSMVLDGTYPAAAV